jgi:dipeptidyl aminopeptidase/acylaminoacyl peptidase
MPRIAPYGTWSSPFSAATIAEAGLRLGAVQVDGRDVYWLEGRPAEGGRYVLLRWRPGGAIEEVVPREFNVRTRVHEYGGGAYLVRGGNVYCVNFADQRVYRIDLAESASRNPAYVRGDPQPLTPEGAWRYADFELDERRRRLICVREDHTQQGREAINTLVSIPIGSRGAAEADDDRLSPAKPGHSERTLSAGEVIASGYDFYSTPRLSPDGSRLAWLAWRHPAMPWDGTELWVADVDESGALVNRRHLTGSESESIYQPAWSPGGDLYFASDKTGWWQLYRAMHDPNEPNGWSVPNHPNVTNDPNASKAEFGRPQWVFGTSTFTFAGPSRLVVSYARQGRWHLASVDLGGGTLTGLASGLQPHDWLAADKSHVVLVAGSETSPDALIRIDLATAQTTAIRTASPRAPDVAYVSLPQPIEFPTADGDTAHAFYYAPRNSDCAAPAGESPPLIVISHGGPTAATDATLDLQTQYWTSRGFALVDVNYRGSSGYGRAYRERLNGRWGIVDVDDVINAARYLCMSGRADAERLIIRGGSAGGYTTLAALTFHPGVFKAGASYYGISDLEVLEIDTHKFESRYSHSLIGPYPEAKDVYRARSPIHAIERLASPLILFQGLEDKIVPPNQSEMMADAVRAKGLAVAYLAFEGEQHGFRKADTIIRCLEAELFFYGRVFGFTPADRINPVPIENL